MKTTCDSCKKQVELWNKKCKGCGFTLVLEPQEKTRAKYLRTPSLGALLFTQAWCFGARLYLWFVLSLFPIVGLVPLIVITLFGRRWSWQYGGWGDWEEFTQRMRILDIIAIAWIVILMSIWIYFRFFSGQSF